LSKIERLGAGTVRHQAVDGRRHAHRALRIDERRNAEPLQRSSRLAMEKNTKTAAVRIGVLVGRISQLRQKLHAAWCRFQGEVVPAQLPEAASA
jgi:hypothetical protein